MPNILITISNGFEEIEAISIIDICRRANIKVTIAGVEGLEISGAHGIKIISDEKIENISSDDFDMIVLPGGLPNAFTLAENKKVQSLLKEFKNKNKKIGAICAAPYALHKADVLNENYTCYPSFEKKIKENGYHADDNVVIDSNVITSRGPATAMIFALEIVNLLCDKEIYNGVKDGLLAKDY
ncbi:DJ-1 family protein [Arcobacter suis]|uniref:DJ-1 family protein n=1 Tax=Arcobacter suis CECT 7833 TaxID=663365 RepID=A0AAD0STG7_9BACT|nr:DJ-1 family glyoxalase III [Arcobacter suis]AXX90940.1 DJ-1 family protein [Arcobacter suis CECT 7833]RWS46926.1 DJ-1 family protein [Arcobacter suis]